MKISTSSTLNSVVSVGYVNSGPGPGPSEPSYLIGGVVTVEDHGGTDYRVHTFNESGTLTFVDVAGSLSVDYLVVAGGGSGGSLVGGGGGAGGYLSGTSESISADQVVSIGAGGAIDTNGSGSSLGSIASATGGGKGGHSDSISSQGQEGGSGGGAQGWEGDGSEWGLGTVGQGNEGGASSRGDNNSQGGGGGGGASTVGEAATSNKAGDGGDGSVWFDGNIYAGGGGGAKRTTSGTPGTSGLGGSGGGGNSAAAGTTSVAGLNGTANTGGGGGATNLGSEGQSTGLGGSGVVKVRYPDHPSYPPAIVASSLLWYDFSDADSYSVTGTTVTTLSNKGSTSGDLTGANGPDINTATLNSLPVATFPTPESTSGFLEVTSWPGDNPYTSNDGYHGFMLVEATNNSTSVLWGDRARVEVAVINDDISFRLNPSGSTNSVAKVSGLTYSPPTWYLCEFWYSIADQNIYMKVDGTTVAGHNLITGTVLSPSGSLLNSDSNSLAEFITWDRLLTAEEQTEVRNYFNDKWGVS